MLFILFLIIAFPYSLTGKRGSAAVALAPDAAARKRAAIDIDDECNNDGCQLKKLKVSIPTIIAGNPPVTTDSGVIDNNDDANAAPKKQAAAPN